jgi:hypothetical protein
VRVLKSALLCLILANCSTTPTELNEKAAPVVQTYPENYQEIYRRTSSTARRCIAGNVGAYASFAVDADLFPDLGYGEMTISLINWGVRNYYVTVRFDKQPAGTRMTSRAGNSLGADNWLQKVQRWAAGEQDC